MASRAGQRTESVLALTQALTAALHRRVERCRISITRHCSVKVYMHGQGLLRDGCFLRQMAQMRLEKGWLRRQHGKI